MLKPLSRPTLYDDGQSAPTPERKRLVRYAQTDGDQTKGQVKSVAETINDIRSVHPMHKNGTAIPRALIWAQDGGNINRSVF